MNINSLLIIGYASAIVLFLSTPGPVTVMVANTSAKYGFKSGLATIAGTNFASLILMAVSFVVIQGIFSVSETALMTLALLGSFYLIYFSVGIIRDKIDLEQMTHDDSIKMSKNHFRDGFMVAISNPKDVLFFIAFFPTFFGVAENHYLSMLILAVIWVILDYSILSTYSLIFSRITNGKLVNIISKLSGTILLLAAVYGVYRSIVELLN